MISNGMLIEQELATHLPKKAKDAKIEKDSFGSAVLTCQYKSGASGPILSYGGILPILADPVLFLINPGKPKSASF